MKSTYVYRERRDSKIMKGLKRDKHTPNIIDKNYL